MPCLRSGIVVPDGCFGIAVSDACCGLAVPGQLFGVPVLDSSSWMPVVVDVQDEVMMPKTVSESIYK